MIYLYTLEHCPNCEKLKEDLIARGIKYTEKNMGTAESLSELRFLGCFSNEAPVVQCGDVVYEYRDCRGEGFFDEIRESE